MLIFTDSFERQRLNSGERSKWNGNQGTYQTGGTQRTGSWCTISDFSLWKRQVRSTEEHATFILGIAIKNGSALSGTDFCVFYSDSGATTHVTVIPQSDGSFAVYRGTSGGTLLGTTAPSVIKNASTWQYVEVKAVLHDTAGSVVIHVDETEVLNLSGIDTKNAGTKTVFDAFGFRSPCPLDDIYVCNGAGSINNDFRGNRRVEQLKPSGNGNSSVMTNSAGNSTNNYSYVNDNAVSPANAPLSTTYVDGISTGDKDTYAFGDSSQPTGNAVDGIIVWAWAQKTDAGARGVTAVARLSGVESTVAMVPNTPTDSGLQNSLFDWHYAVFETKPGGGAWTVADVNNAEFGVQAS